MCDVEKIDVELFIMEVEKRACLWDSRIEDYKDRKLKDSAWYEICCALFPNFTELPNSKRKFVSQKLQLKWRNIRDYYRKYMKKDMKSGSGAVKKFKYVFADQLNFLSPVLDMRSSSVCSLTNDAEDSEELVEGNSDAILTSLTPTQTSADLDSKPRSRPKNMNHKLKRSQFLDNYSKSTLHVEDEDRSFFDSLLSVIRTFDMDQKLEFRSEVLHILQRMRRTKLQLQRSYPPYQTSTHPLSISTGQVEYPTTSHIQIPNIYNLTPAQQSRTQNSKSPAGESGSDLLNTASPESDLSPFSDDNQT